MFLTLREAAARSGRSERQIRYLIQQGKLTAEKRAGRWFVELENVPKSTSQSEANARRKERLRDRVEEALDLSQADETPRRYSLRNLRAFQIARPLLHRVQADCGGDHPASRRLHDAVEQLAMGCHRFDRTEKADAYRAARDAASRALCALLMEPHGDHGEHADVIEQDLMPAFAGLLRRVERRRRP